MPTVSTNERVHIRVYFILLMTLIITIPGLVFDHIVVILRSCSFQVILQLLLHVCYALVLSYARFFYLNRLNMDMF